MAASDDLTGAANLGGDWVLETHNGLVTSKLAVQDQVLADYQSLLVLVNNGTQTGTIGWDAITANSNVVGGTTGRTGGEVLTITNHLSSGFDIVAKNDASSSSTSFTIRKDRKSVV